MSFARAVFSTDSAKGSILIYLFQNHTPSYVLPSFVRLLHIIYFDVNVLMPPIYIHIQCIATPTSPPWETSSSDPRTHTHTHYVSSNVNLNLISGKVVAAGESRGLTHLINLLACVAASSSIYISSRPPYTFAQPAPPQTNAIMYSDRAERCLVVFAYI